ncbi:MAG: signal peptidase I [Thermoanaerobaculia bacterium]|nr:signal peptidase I [Thermoanaerobaculia bacterium]
MMIIWLAVIVVMIAAMWKVFVKAGEPGWAALVPIYNIVVMLKIAGKPAWWVILFLIPFVNLVMAIIMSLAIAKNFGKGTGFGLGLAFLSPIFYPMLAWGDARYQPQPLAPPKYATA